MGGRPGGGLLLAGLIAVAVFAADRSSQPLLSVEEGP